ncbi:hypothetical protein BDQ12DRAFT_729574 [Crucibulum laeve]|uniref:Uncharacterized protein n=1 Tax=Crucibulum laeve TaxID=68775 RepID=A0A5C3LEY7_9AGAR|nr:hypothetical protein BDQ12DRAFT_729574 [Crucibulum laeve]
MTSERVLEHTHTNSFFQPTPENVEFTVHNYAQTTGSTLRGTSSELLDIGHKMIQAASTKFQSTRWIKPRLNNAAKKKENSGKQYIYGHKLPIFSGIKGKGHDLKISKTPEWDSLVMENEVFTISELEEFESVDLSQTNKRPAPPEPLEEPPRKKVKLEDGTLHRLIPQPHMHPSPFPTRAFSAKAIPYRRVPSVPIPPHVLPIPAPDAYARSAWIIPIRGAMPWDLASPATLASSDDNDNFLPSAPTTPSEQIIWTPDAVLQFWNFLLKLRKAESLGALGVSFHAARSSPSASSSSTSSYGMYDLVQNQLGVEYLESATLLSESDKRDREGGEEGKEPLEPVRYPLSSIDHIKIYQCAKNAMYIRNALDLWRYVHEPLPHLPWELDATAAAPSSSTPTPLSSTSAATATKDIKGKQKESNAAQNSEKGKTQQIKVRLLKGTRLVLLDERSKGILIS